MNQQDIKSKSIGELKDDFAKLGLKPFAAGQVYSWLHRKRVNSFDEMTDLSVKDRARLSERYFIERLEIRKKLVSKLDGTIKYLFALRDGNAVETVLMRYKHGWRICVSSQVGCKMGCRFCASGQAGFVRDLTPAEIVEQVYLAGSDSGHTINGAVIMGIGEPLDNYDNVVRFLQLLSSPQGMNLSLRHVSLSTCGLVDEIEALAKLKLGLTLSVSLHAPNDGIRDELMPINKRYGVDALLEACQRYFQETGRRVSFEYAMIGGVNDSAQNARELASRLKGTGCHVNLIPVNAVKEFYAGRTSNLKMTQFSDILNQNGVTCTVRRELGADINAACGQLRREI